MRDWKRILYVVLGWLFLALGAVGLFLPLLPTTPFVLLASSCFLRSSPRLRRWLMNSRWFGPTLREWDEHQAVRPWVKVVAVTAVAVVIALAIIRDLHWAVRATIVVLGGVGIAVVWKLPVIGRISGNGRPANEPTAPSPSGEQGRR